MPRRLVLFLAPLVGVLLLTVLPAEAASKIVRVISPGGLEAWLVQAPSIPILSLEVAWRNAGSKLDPPDKSGLVNLAAGLLDEGAGDLDSSAFHGKVEDLGVALDFEAGRDSFRASLRTLSEHRDAAFQLLALALSKPRFDAEPVERVRRQTLSQLSRQEEDPDSLATRALFAAAFPKHPYGVPSDGRPADLARIGHDDLAGFVQAHLARDNLVIGVVGDVTPAELGPLLDRTFGALPAKAAPAAVAEIEPASGHGPEVITRNEPQSVIAFAGPGVKRADPDFYAAYVLSHVLGSDSLTSRLGEAVRVKRGLVYTIYLQAVPFGESALELGGFATRNEKVGEALKLVRQVLADVREHGISAAELADAKTAINGSFPLTLSSNSRIAAFLMTIQLDRLGIDYLDRRAKLMDAVTLADVQRVARRLLDPDKLLVVVVGKPQGLGG